MLFKLLTITAPTIYVQREFLNCQKIELAVRCSSLFKSSYILQFLFYEVEPCERQEKRTYDTIEGTVRCRNTLHISPQNPPKICFGCCETLRNATAIVFHSPAPCEGSTWRNVGKYRWRISAFRQRWAICSEKIRPEIRAGKSSTRWKQTIIGCRCLTGWGSEKGWKRRRGERRVCRWSKGRMEAGNEGEDKGKQEGKRE